MKNADVVACVIADILTSAVAVGEHHDLLAGGVEAAPAAKLSEINSGISEKIISTSQEMFITETSEIIHINLGGNLGTHDAPDLGQAQAQAQAEDQAEVVNEVVREAVPSYQDRIYSVRQTQPTKADTLKMKTTQTDIRRWSQTHENSKIGGEGTP